MRTPPLLADFIHPRACRPKCEKLLTLPYKSVLCELKVSAALYFQFQEYIVFSHLQVTPQVVLQGYAPQVSPMFHKVV